MDSFYGPSILWFYAFEKFSQQLCNGRQLIPLEMVQELGDATISDPRFKKALFWGPIVTSQMVQFTWKIFATSYTKIMMWEIMVILIMKINLI